MALGITEEEFRYPVDYNHDVDFTTIKQADLYKYQLGYKPNVINDNFKIFPRLLVSLSRRWVNPENKAHETIKDMLKPWSVYDQFTIGEDEVRTVDGLTDEELESTLSDSTQIYMYSSIFSSSQSFLHQIAPYVVTSPVTLAKLNLPFEELVPSASILAKNEWEGIQPWVSLNTVGDHYYVLGFNLMSDDDAVMTDFEDTLLMQNQVVQKADYTHLTDDEKSVLSSQEELPLIFSRTLGDLRAMKADGLYPDLTPSDFLAPYAEIIENHLTDLSKRLTASIQGFKVKAPFRDTFSWSEIEPISKEEWEELVNQRVIQDIDLYKVNGIDQDVALFNEDIKESGVLTYEELLTYIDFIEEDGWFYERLT